MPKTAIIYGGVRDHGNTIRVINTVAQKISADVFDVSHHQISFYDHEHKNRDDDFLPLIKNLVQYDRWIFASPVYWYTMSAQLKVFVDRISDLMDIEQDLGRQLRGLGAALIATGIEESCPTCYEDVFIHSFNYLDMNYLGCLYVDTSNPIDPDEFESQLNAFVEVIGD
jgi:multimeric flavodoxin WrbA